MTLDEIIASSDGAVFNNASQVYNHNVYFQGLSGEPSEPSGTLAAWIERDFGSIDAFKDAFLAEAAGLFGSGWVWLCVNKQEHLEIVPLANAQSPRRKGYVPLMTCDVWEHAYYIDYRNARPEYLEAWWELIDWSFVGKKLEDHVSGKYVEFPCDDYSGECAFHED